MSTENINFQSTKSPMSSQSFISQTSVTSISHTSSRRRPFSTISQSDSVSASTTSRILISSGVSTTSSSTSSPQENSLPAIVGGLVGIIVVLLLLLVLCAIVVFAMMFRSKKKKVVALRKIGIEAQCNYCVYAFIFYFIFTDEEVGPNNELAFRNELYDSKTIKCMCLVISIMIVF